MYYFDLHIKIMVAFSNKIKSCRSYRLGKNRSFEKCGWFLVESGMLKLVLIWKYFFGIVDFPGEENFIMRGGVLKLVSPVDRVEYGS